MIGSCIIKILNLMEHTNQKKLKSLILLIDFRKAFDSLSHKYINECLRMFNFGPSIRKWVSLFIFNKVAYIHLGEELTRRIFWSKEFPGRCSVIICVYIGC